MLVQQVLNPTPTFRTHYAYLNVIPLKPHAIGICHSLSSILDAFYQSWMHLEERMWSESSLANTMWQWRSRRYKAMNVQPVLLHFSFLYYSCNAVNLCSSLTWAPLSQQQRVNWVFPAAKALKNGESAFCLTLQFCLCEQKSCCCRNRQIWRTTWLQIISSQPKSEVLFFFQQTKMAIYFDLSKVKYPPMD